MLDKAQILQMIEGIKGNLAELETALGTDGESEMQPEDMQAVEGEEVSGNMGEGMPSGGNEEGMPPMLKKFMRG